MVLSFDKCDTRPADIDAVLNGLDRYNPETTTVFQNYVSQQCEDRTFDCYANLALLKLYQFNPHLLHPETTTNILCKALTVFPSPAFSLSLALLPPSTLPFAGGASGGNTSNDFIESIQKLTHLNTLLENAQYAQFWTDFNADDLYADLVADVSGFEELIRVRIAVEVGKAFREIDIGVLEGWLDLRAEALERFCREVCGWEVDAAKKVVRPPRTKENEARGEVKGERVGVDQFARVIRRAYEQPA